MTSREKYWLLGMGIIVLDIVAVLAAIWSIKQGNP